MFVDDNKFPYLLVAGYYQLYCLRYWMCRSQIGAYVMHVHCGFRHTSNTTDLSRQTETILKNVLLFFSGSKEIRGGNEIQ